MRAIEFYHNASGAPMVRGTDSVLVAFLSTDCQGSEAVIDAVLALTTGDSPYGEFIGNAHQIEVDQSGVKIVSLYNDDSDQTDARHLSTTHFRATVEAWRRFVTTG